MSDILVTVASTTPVVAVVGQQGPAGPPVPTGTNTRVLFSDNDLVGTSAAFTFNKATNTLTVTNLAASLAACTGLPISTGVSGLAAGVANFLGAPSSANLAAAVTDETGTGALVFATSPALVTPLLGTPTSGTLTNCTGLPIATGVSGLGAGVATFLATPSSANLRTAVTDETGTGALVFGTSPTISGSATFDGAGSTTTAQIALNGATNNWIGWNTNGFAPPAFTTRSIGTKLVLRPDLTASALDYAIGVDANVLWFTAQGTGSLFKFYAGAIFPFFESGAGFNRLYNSGVTNDATNFERGEWRWSANELQLAVVAGGTGTATRALRLTTASSLLLTGDTSIIMGTGGTTRWTIANAGHLTAFADNTQDIGAAGASRPRSIYVGTSVVTTLVQNQGGGTNLSLDTASGTSVLGTSAGTLKWVYLDGANSSAIRPATDNSTDIGIPATRVRTGYFATSVVTPQIQFSATQIASADPNNLDDYEEGTFTPALIYTGGSTGIAYASRSGKYTKVGNRVDINITISLSSKGSSTGNVLITGFPFTPSETVVCATMMNSSTGISGAAFTRFINGSSNADVFFTQTGNVASVSDANLTNTSTFNITGTYFTA